ncbi:serine acetyltransferase [Enterobacter hormaechei]|uniref:serine acetyltransferase n=1 Tax=Enterobacter hormaechei TaxID=158836 RepID=UPI0013D027A5|nr:serine acetyltransferase [Enterobacter hormaechei]
MSKEINAEHSIRQLFRYWHIEVIGINKEFSFIRLFSKLRNKPGLKYVFWWRTANFFYMNGYKKVAYFLHGRIKKKFSCDIMLGAQIGEGLTIAHHVGVVVTKRVKAGRNMKLTQNCVIGSVGKTNGVIVIGDDFFLGSNSCVISDSLVIGDNVTIGAMSFVNKDLSSNTTVYTEKVLRTIEKTASPSVA